MTQLATRRAAMVTARNRADLTRLIPQPGDGQAALQLDTLIVYVWDKDLDDWVATAQLEGATGDGTFDNIYEVTPDHGVNVDGVLLKDGDVTAGDGDFSGNLGVVGDLDVGGTLTGVAGTFTGLLTAAALLVTGAATFNGDFTVNTPTDVNISAENIALTTLPTGVLTINAPGTGSGGITAALDNLDVVGTGYVSLLFDGQGDLQVQDDLNVYAAGDLDLSTDGTLFVAATGGVALTGGLTVDTLTATSRVTTPRLGTVTATDVVFDRNSVAQLTLGSLTATFAGSVLPTSSNAQDFGTTALPWQTLHARTSVTFGASASTVGFLRFNNAPGTIMAIRDSGGGADQLIFRVTGASNDIVIGNTSVLNSIAFSTTSGTVTQNSTGTLSPSTGTQDLGAAAANWRSAYFSTAVHIGVAVAATGALRLGNTQSLIWRNAANLADINGMQVYSDNKVYLGQLSSGLVSAHNFVPDANNTRALGAAGTVWSNVFTPTVDSGGATDLLLKRNAVTQLTLESLSATFAGTLTVSGGFLAVGTNPATLGELRLPNGFQVRSGTGNDFVMSYTSGSSLDIGPAAVSTPIRFFVGATGWTMNISGHLVATGTTNTQDLGTTSVTLKSGYFGTSLTSPILDSGSATNLILRRNGVTQLTLASLAATFAGSLTVTSGATITTGDLTVSAGQANLFTAGTTVARMRNTGGTVDQRTWDWRVTTGGVLELRSSQDSGTTVVNAMGFAHATGYVGFASQARFGSLTGASVDTGLWLSALASTGTIAYGIRSDPTFAATTTSTASALYAQVVTAASAFTVASASGLRINTPSIGAGSAVTTGIGIWIQAQTYTGSTNAHGLRIESVTGATNNFAIYTDSGAVRFGDTLTTVGNIGVGTTAAAFRGINLASTLSGSGTQRFVDITGTYDATATTARGVQIVPSFTNNGATTINYQGVYVGAVALGGGTHAITTVHGLFIEAQTVGGTNRAITTLGGVHFLTGHVVPGSTDNTYNLGGSANAYSNAFVRNVDSGSANDLVLKRNAVTQLTLGSLLATFAGDVDLASSKVYKVNGTQVVTSRRTGYTNAMTGTKDRATAYDTTTITLPQLAARVGALLDDLTTHGLIGA